MNLFQRLRRTKIYSPGLNKTRLNRLNWEQIEARPRQEGRNVVKGTSKRVVVVKSPDPRIFEQAIFIVREDVLSRRGKDGQGAILREAQDVADRYIRGSLPRQRGRKMPRLPPQALIGAGAALLAGIVWAGLHFVLGIL